jgi:hypothetical protein
VLGEPELEVLVLDDVSWIMPGTWWRDEGVVAGRVGVGVDGVPAVLVAAGVVLDALAHVVHAGVVGLDDPARPEEAELLRHAVVRERAGSE